MSKNRLNRSKIVATVGPASNNKETLKQLIEAGANVFRLNFSHGSHQDHQKVIDLVRELNDEMGTHVALLQDLQGPKIRTNQIENGEVQIKAGDKLTITTEDMEGNNEVISTTYQNLPKDVKPGEMILIDDGKLELLVEESDEKSVITKVIYGGPLKSRKGINLPQSNVSAPSLTDKDEKDLEFGLSQDLDWVALSFVREAKDIIDLKARIETAGTHTKVVAKIEKPEALKNIDAILEATDGVMVARGDLGVEIEMEDVPVWQKIIVEKCNALGKPVIIATQMMESMIENPRPTRAETNDVANAVLDGADALMLSAESAAGKYPVLAVKSMARTILAIENNQEEVYNKFPENVDPTTHENPGVMLIRSACQLSKNADVKAIISMTKSGFTGYEVAKYRPKAEIYVFTDDRKLINQLSLIWGVRGFWYDKMESINKTFEDLQNKLKNNDLLEVGDIVVNTASMPLHWKGHTNMMKINEVE